MDSVDKKKKRAIWTQESMSKAIADIRHKRLSVNAASKKYNIPRRTIRRYLEIRKPVKFKLGCKSTLTKEQERQLCKKVFSFAEIGFPLTSKMLSLSVFRFCLENKISNRFAGGQAGRWWLKAFLARNSEVKSRIVKMLNNAQAQELDKSMVRDHFEKLQKILAKNNLLDFPEKIFNMDEKCCRLHLHKDPQMFVKEESKATYIVAKEHGESAAIVACGSAIGLVIPPMILFSGVRKNPAWERNLPTGSFIKMTSKGSMTTEIFIEFLKHFSRFKPSGTCLLIVDGAKSDLDYKIYEVAEENDILLYCLPPNTTHVLQPLDKDCFQNFEIFWDQYALLYFDRYKGKKEISRLYFADVFTSTWEESMTLVNMKNGFRATGIFPFNPSVIPEKLCEPSTAIEQLPVKTEIVDNILPSTLSATDNQPPVTGMSGLQENVHQQHHAQYPVTFYYPHCSLFNSDNSEVVDKSSNPFSDDSTWLDSPQVHRNLSDQKFLTEMLPSLERKKKKTIYLVKNPIPNYRILLQKLFGDKEEDTKAEDCTKAKEMTMKSFTEMLPSPERKKKKTIQIAKSANNSYDVVLQKLFDDEEDKKVKPDTDKKLEDCIKAEEIAVPKNTLSKSTENWYCTLCCRVEVKDMRLCGVCGMYVHEECVGLTEKDNDLFICPKCV